MKRFDSMKAVMKFGAISQAKAAILALDIAIAYASIAKLETKIEDGEELTIEETAAHRACLQVVEQATVELCGIAADNMRDLHDSLPMVPKGLGPVCRACGCSGNDPCTVESGGKLIGCSWVRTDLCSSCHDRGLTDGSEEIPPETTIN